MLAGQGSLPLGSHKCPLKLSVESIYLKRQFFVPPLPTDKWGLFFWPCLWTVHLLIRSRAEQLTRVSSRKGRSWVRDRNTATLHAWQLFCLVMTLWELDMRLPCRGLSHPAGSPHIPGWTFPDLQNLYFCSHLRICPRDSLIMSTTFITTSTVAGFQHGSCLLSSVKQFYHRSARTHLFLYLGWSQLTDTLTESWPAPACFIPIVLFSKPRWC